MDRTGRKIAYLEEEDGIERGFASIGGGFLGEIGSGLGWTDAWRGDGKGGFFFRDAATQCAGTV